MCISKIEKCILVLFLLSLSSCGLFKSNENKIEQENKVGVFWLDSLQDQSEELLSIAGESSANSDTLQLWLKSGEEPVSEDMKLKLLANLEDLGYATEDLFLNRKEIIPFIVYALYDSNAVQTEACDLLINHVRKEDILKYKDLIVSSDKIKYCVEIIPFLDLSDEEIGEFKSCNVDALSNTQYFYLQNDSVQKELIKKAFPDSNSWVEGVFLDKYGSIFENYSAGLNLLWGVENEVFLDSLQRRLLENHISIEPTYKQTLLYLALKNYARIYDQDTTISKVLAKWQMLKSELVIEEIGMTRDVFYNYVALQFKNNWHIVLPLISVDSEFLFVEPVMDVYF